jgi:outer membrane murein-binding lipoprotein Lpp
MKKSKILAVSVIALSLGLGGCKSMKRDTSNSDQVAQLEAKISSQNSEIDRINAL